MVLISKGYSVKLQQFNSCQQAACRKTFFFFNLISCFLPLFYLKAGQNEKNTLTVHGIHQNHNKEHKTQVINHENWKDIKMFGLKKNKPEKAGQH